MSHGTTVSVGTVLYKAYYLYKWIFYICLLHRLVFGSNIARHCQLIISMYIYSPKYGLCELLDMSNVLQDGV